ncbi:hypothetical protein EI94DRAFT_1701054 [Lactarius quietus]|nr:hypothetical protein EI94DRAFT_1701054 [Lactarius quietus]
MAHIPLTIINIDNIPHINTLTAYDEWNNINDPLSAEQAKHDLKEAHHQFPTPTRGQVEEDMGGQPIMTEDYASMKRGPAEAVPPSREERQQRAEYLTQQAYCYDSVGMVLQFSRCLVVVARSLMKGSTFKCLQELHLHQHWQLRSIRKVSSYIGSYPKTQQIKFGSFISAAFFGSSCLPASPLHLHCNDHNMYNTMTDTLSGQLLSK